MNPDELADTPDRHVLREALGALTRAAERFQAVIPTGHITHADARDLIADADHLAHRLYQLTRAHQKAADAQLAERASAYLGTRVTVETVDALDLAARAPAFPQDDDLDDLQGKP